MINLDDIIGRMKASECTNCNCSSAISDQDDQDMTKGQNVRIYGSFCNVVPGHDQIAIVAIDIATDQQVWSRICDTGHMCEIPFTSDEGFTCDDELEEE